MDQFFIKLLTLNNLGTILWVMLSIFAIVAIPNFFTRLNEQDDGKGSSLTFKHIKDALEAKRGGPPKKTFGRRLGKTPAIKKRFAAPVPSKINE